MSQKGLFVMSILGVLHAYYPRDLDSRRRTRVYPEGDLLPMGRGRYPTKHITAPWQDRSSSALGEYSSGNVSYGETRLARVRVWCFGTYPADEIFSLANSCRQTTALF